ncbi:MAG: tetratricopeptide repeat protein [Niastella sp.]|nr:tetratricopeptide repeat protein [Niastella sp.]
MKRLLLSVIFLMASLYTFSRQEKKDIASLQSALQNTTENSEKTALLTEISLFYYFADSLDKSIAHAKELLALGNSTGSKQATDAGNIILGICYGWQNKISLSEHYLQPYRDITSVQRDTPVYRAMFGWYGSFYSSFKKDYDKAISYAFKVLALQQPAESNKTANTYAFLGDNYYLKGDLLPARKYWKKAEPFMHTNSLLILNIGKTFNWKGPEGDSVLFYANKALELTRKDGNKKVEADCHFYIGSVYLGRRDTREAESHLMSSLSLFRMVGDTYMTGLLLNNIGEAHLLRADYPKAFEFFDESLKIGERLQHKELMLVNYNDMAVSLKSNQDYQRALSCLSKALAIMGDSDPLKIRGDIEGNIGCVYLCLNDTINAKRHFNNALSNSGHKGNVQYLGPLINNLSSIYLLQGAYKRSMELVHDALTAARKGLDSSTIALSYTRLGKIYLEMSKDSNITNRPDSLRNLPVALLQQRAAVYLDKAANFYQKKESYEPLHESFRLLAEAQDSSGDYKTALVNYQRYISARDSAINLEKIKEFAELKSRLEIEKNESLAKARLQSWLITGGVVLVAIVFIFSLYRRKEKSRFNLELSALKQEALNAQMSDHFIGNTMDSINAFILQNDQEQASKYLIMFSRLIRKVLENSSQRLIPLNEDIEVLTSYLELEKLRFHNGFSYSIIIDQSIDPDHTLVPPMVLQVLAENSIKHGLAKRDYGQLSIKIDSKGDTIVCQVADNGTGRQLTTDATGKGRKSIGSGLAQRLLQASNRNKGLVSFGIKDMVDSNNHPTGTSVEFTLPHISIE